MTPVGISPLTVVSWFICILGKVFPNAYTIWCPFFTQEILKDFSENDFLTIKTEVKQVLSNRKEITEFLEKWLNTHFDTENLKSSIQKENKSIGLVNNFYHSKITVSITVHVHTLMLCFYFSTHPERVTLACIFCNLYVGAL